MMLSRLLDCSLFCRLVILMACCKSLMFFKDVGGYCCLASFRGVVCSWFIRHNPYRVAGLLEMWCEKSKMLFQSLSSCFSQETKWWGGNQMWWGFLSRSLWFVGAWPAPSSLDLKPLGMGCCPPRPSKNLGICSGLCLVVLTHVLSPS